MLNKYNYQQYASMYNAEVNAAPSQIIAVSKAFAANTAGEYRNIEGEIEIPDGYEAFFASGSAGFMFQRDKVEWSSYTICIGESYFVRYGITADSTSFSFYNINSAEKTLGVGITLSDVGSFSCSVRVSCELTYEALEKWQNETYKAIIDAYEAKLKEYNDAMAGLTANNTAAVNSVRYNPLQARTIESGELKKNCLQLLLEPYGLATGVNTLKADGTIDISSAFGTHADKVRFFEAAFEWEIMSYIFYPYFWADKSKWQALYTSEDGDPLFQAFLQAGMGKVILSVRPGYEEAVMYYLQTGQLWDGKDLAIDDELYLSVLAEQLPAEGTPEGEPWETRLPTSLTVLQADSVAVTETGLPCACDDGTGNGFESNRNVITIPKTV